MDIETEFERAVALHRSGQSADAEALCRAILAEAPQHARALHLLGVIRFAAGDAGAAIARLRQALSIRPDYSDAEFNLGVMVAANGALSEALEHFSRVAALRPDHADAHIRRGAMLLALERLEEADAAFRRALELRPDDGLVLADLTSVAFARGDSRGAIEYGRKAVTRLPDSAEIHLRLARALIEQGNYDEALDALRRARELAPASVAAASELAAAHLARGEVEAAVVLFHEAVRLAPDDLEQRRRLLGALLYSPAVTPDERLAAHEEFGRAAEARVTAPLPPPPNDRDPDRKLRIGWLSSDLRDHPVARNLEPLFAHRDRARFETVVYADIRRPDAATDWFRGQSDLWRPVTGRSDAEVAALIRSDAIDIMIYVAGRFDRNRPQIAAWRPAPVQISLHDPATSGMREIDFLVADPVLVPRGTAERFVERVLRLPNFIVQPPISWAAPSRRPPSQERGYVMFGSFNNPAKLNGAVLKSWAEVLRRVPTSRLLLKYRGHFRNAGFRDRITRELGAEIASRVEFDFSDRPMAEHLKDYEKVDIALDPFPFTGSTTTFEALWMGVPVVSLAGDHMVGRWSASMLTAVEAPELMAGSTDNYVRIAVELAASPDRLARLRAMLRDRVAASRLCDGRRTMRYVERGLRAVWRMYCDRAARSTARGAIAYSFDDDADYLAKLHGLITAGAAEIAFDAAKLREMDSPVVIIAETERWAMGMVAVCMAAWWFLGIWPSAGVAAASMLAYALLGRRWIARNIGRRIHQKALQDIVMWRALWRYGGISLRATRQTHLVCAAPRDSWIQFVERLITTTDN